MERLKANTGGRPLKNEDLQLYFQSFELFEGLLKDLGEDLIIVYGCEFTEVGIDISAGVVWVDGELRVFDGVAGASLPYKLTKSVTDNKLRPYFDGVTKATSETLKVSADAGGAWQFDVNTPRLSEYLNRNTDRYVRKTIDIGTFDMSSTGPVTKSINHNLSADEWKTARGLTADIINDTQTEKYGIYTGGDVSIGSASVTVISTPAGFFDSASFQGTAINRGTVSFEYIPD